MDYYAEYQRAKKKYNSATSEKKTWQKKKSAAETDLKNSKNKLSDAKNDKMNLEKRLDGVKKIIQLLQGRGGLFAANPPTHIDKNNRYAADAGDAYAECIRSDAMSAASIADAFTTETVEANTYSSSALSKLNAEQKRLEAEIEKLKQQIKTLESNISTLNKTIRTCSSQISSLERTARRASSDASYYRRKYRESL